MIATTVINSAIVNPDDFILRREAAEDLVHIRAVVRPARWAPDADDSLRDSSA
jgi:hypothetical protein